MTKNDVEVNLKVYLKAYINKNLGDDLFIKVITDRYKNCKFYIDADSKYLKIDNLKSYRQNKLKKNINRLIKLISKGKKSLDNYYMLNKDLCVIIGGSMFIENKYSNMLRKSEKIKKDYYILGANFGPYESEWYFNKYYNFFKDAKDVCFREKKSYYLFKSIPQVRSASDIIFSFDTKNVIIKKSKKVIISVIDCSKKIKGDFNYKETYENKICELIDIFRKKGYSIKLMSFCKSEGDENAIASILSKCENKEDIEIYYYRGNVDEALNVLGDSSVIIGTRFHANILGMILNKTVIPIAYSDKTLNVLNDMNFKGRIFDIRDEEKFDVQSITDEELNYISDITNQVNDANNQFYGIDKVIK